MIWETIDFTLPLYNVFVVYLGLCMGSFLNVCIYRIPLDQSVSLPASHCFSCKTPIKFYDNIPVLSYLLLRGKCRKCGEGYSPRYMIVEIITGILFWLVWQKYGLSWITPVYWLVIFGLLLGSFVDLDHMIIPDRVTWGGILLGLIISPLVPELHGAETAKDGFLTSLGGACIGFGILYLVGTLGTLAFKKEAMGFGDVKLLGAIGAFLGWEATLFTLVISAFLGSAVGVTFIAMKKRELQAQIPFGPYISAAAVLWMFKGPPILEWYMSLMRMPEGP